MNKDNARDYLPLVQALAEGKVIQSYVCGGWSDDKDVDFTLDASRYRIKPEPREIWVNSWDPAGNVIFDSPEEAEEHAKRYRIGHVTTRYREVIE